MTDISPDSSDRIVSHPKSQSGGAARDSAAQERVTSEELTQALSRIEARREEESKRVAGTIPLGQAVEELGLAISPDELFAEVQAQRQTVVPTQHLSSADVLPPAPGPQQSADESPLTHCPACSRKLLTQASALCNWCGAKISDPQYQRRAVMSRQTLDQQERQQIETLVLEEARYGIFGRLKRRAKQDPVEKKPLG